MPVRYIHQALSHSLINSSNQVYIGAFLHKLVFGRCEIDDHAQEFFVDKRSVIVEPKTFFPLTEALLGAKKTLLALASGNGVEDEMEGTQFEQSRNYL